MQTFLVPVDFSAASDNALIYAANLAQSIKARLLLLHAYMLPTPVSEVPYVMITADELQKENEQMMKKTSDRLTQQFQVEITTIVRLGIASDEVKAVTRDQKVDLVIMGMKGAGGLEKIIGSTTTNVIHKVSTPVLIVPHDAVYKHISAIAYASDFKEPAQTGLFMPLIHLARHFNAPINIVHIQSGHGGRDEAETGKLSLQAAFRDHPHQFLTREDSSVNHGINEYLQESGSDLLVMVAHKHSFFERVFSKSHTSSMAHETHTPMLVLPENK